MDIVHRLLDCESQLSTSTIKILNGLINCSEFIFPPETYDVIYKKISQEISKYSVVQDRMQQLISLLCLILDREVLMTHFKCEFVPSSLQVFIDSDFTHRCNLLFKTNFSGSIQEMDGKVRFFDYLTLLASPRLLELLSKGEICETSFKILLHLSVSSKENCLKQVLTILRAFSRSATEQKDLFLLIDSLHCGTISSAQRGLCYALLTSLYSYSGSEGCPLSYHMSDTYWAIVQQGLVNPDPLTRKQSIFLLKIGASQLPGNSCSELPKCVAFLSNLDTQSPVSEHWRTVIYLLETYEETQTHILQSSFPLLYSLASFIKQEEELKCTHSIHYSWLLTLYSRLFSHESRMVQLWSLQAVLECPISHCSQTEVTLFVTRTLILALNTTTIFTRTPVPLIESLIQFFSQYLFVFSTNDAEPILEKLVTSLTFLTDIPLFFLSYVLSKLTPSPIAGRGSIFALQRLFSRRVLVHSHLLRKGIKCFFLRFVTRCINLASCCWADIFMLLTYMEIDFGELAERQEFHNLINALVKLRTIEDSPFIIHIFRVLTSSYIGADYSSSYELSKSLNGEHLVGEWVNKSEGKDRTHETLNFPIKTGGVVAHIACVVGHLCGQSLIRMLHNSLKPVIQLLLGVNTHPYMSDEQTKRAFELTERLITISNNSVYTSQTSVIYPLYNTVTSNLTELALYLINQGNYEDLQQLLSSISTFESANETSRGQHWNSLAVEISSICLPELNNALSSGEIHITRRMSSLVSIFGSILSYTINNESIWPVVSPMVYKLMDSLHFLNDKILTDSTEDRLRFINATLHVISLTHSKELIISGVTLLSLFKDLATVSDSFGLISILSIISSLLPSLFSEHTELCSECVFACWTGVQEESADTNELLSLFPIFLKTCLGKKLLLPTCFHDGDILLTLKSLFNQVIEWGNKRMGVMHMLVAHLVDVWNSPSAIVSMSIYWREIINIFLTSPDLNRSMKQLESVVSFAIHVEEFNFTSWRGDYFQNMTHFYLIELLGVLTDNEIAKLEGYTTLLETIVNEFVRIEIQCSKTNSKNCSFNSHLHRKKLFTWQLILLLLAALQKSYGSNSNYFDEKLILSLLRDHIPANLQPSVRCYIEWSAALLISESTILDDTLLHEMKLYSSSTGVSPSFVYNSYVSTLSLVIKLIQIPAALITEIVAILIGMMSLGNTLLRHLSFDLLKQIRKLPETTELSFLIPLLKYCQDTGRQVEPSNWTMLIDPMEDLTLRCLFEDTPIHFGLKTENLGLDALTGSNWDEKHTVSLGINSDNKNNNVGLNKHFNSCVIEDKVKPNVKVDAKDLMQKKIMPWEIMGGKVCMGLEGRYSELNECSHKGKLILIASLIDKPTNLGGMCRTCEVFGAATLVVSDRKLLEDRSFTSLSVSAERWVSVEEVKTAELPKYITLLKERGYTVVGVEQTPNSVSLQEFSFPKLTTLLMGHEKFGIPIQLLELVDLCVQIPQFGIIRSLNVHVSCAISIWQYTTQHLSDTKVKQINKDSTEMF